MEKYEQMWEELKAEITLSLTLLGVEVNNSGNISTFPTKAQAMVSILRFMEELEKEHA